MTKSSSSRRRGGNTREPDKEDAITILNAVIEFRSKHGGLHPTPTTLKPVFDAVKDSLRQKIAIDQLYNKFRTLKQHYYKAINAGVGPTPFDRLFFDLSVKAWGDKRPRQEEDTKNNKRSSKKMKKVVADDDGDASGEEEEEEEEHEEDGRDSFRFLTDRAKKYWEMHGLPMSSLELGLKFMDRAKATLLDKKWRQHSFAEMKAEVKDFDWKKDVRVSVVAAAKRNTRSS